MVNPKILDHQKVVSETPMLERIAATTGCRMDSPLEWQLRDAHQAANHALISYRHYETVSQTYFGHEPTDRYKAFIGQS